LGGVCHDYTFHLVAVVGAAPKQGSAGFDANDSRKRSNSGAGITGHGNVIAHHRTLFAQFLGQRGIHHAVFVYQQNSVSTSVHSKHHAQRGARVLRADFRAWFVALWIWSNPDIGLV
jgi:hypothetical protein